jgi:hypothetical protein
MKIATITAKVPHATARKIREYAKRNNVTVASLYAIGVADLIGKLAAYPVATVLIGGDENTKED